MHGARDERTGDGRSGRDQVRQRCPVRGRLHDGGRNHIVNACSVRCGGYVQTEGGQHGISQGDDVLAVANGHQGVRVQRSEYRKEVAGAEKLHPSVRKK